MLQTHQVGAKLWGGKGTMFTPVNLVQITCEEMAGPYNGLDGSLFDPMQPPLPCANTTQGWKEGWMALAV